MMPSSDDINSAFGDQWGLLLTVLYGLGLVLYGLGLPYVFLSCYYTGLGLPSAFRSEYYTGLGLPSHFLFQVLYKFGTVFLIEYYTGFGLVLSQVRSVPQLYLRSFEVEGKP